jgi:hypothetical protein
MDGGREGERGKERQRENPPTTLGPELNSIQKPGIVAHTCNHSYSRGRHLKDGGPNQPGHKVRLYLKNKE